METIIIDGLRNIQNGVVNIPIRVTYPTGWKVTAVKNFDEFIEYKWHSRNTKDIDWEYVVAQDFDKHCNGFSIYWLPRVKRIAINRELKIKRPLNVGEGWSFGDNID